MMEIDVDGEPAYVLADDLDELASTDPTKAVRLLPGFDQYVLGPGTADGHVVPSARRAAVSRQAGWISPVAIAGGVVCGTWKQERERIEVAWFREMGKPPRSALEDEVARLSSILGHPLSPAITSA
jgi:DNA glycosylase AlkZ-like